MIPLYDSAVAHHRERVREAELDAEAHRRPSQLRPARRARRLTRTTARSTARTTHAQENRS